MNNPRKSISGYTYTVDISKYKFPTPAFPLPCCYKEITPEDFIIKQGGAGGVVKKRGGNPCMAANFRVSLKKI
jgi:hypothetical protein